MITADQILIARYAAAAQATGALIPTGIKTANYTATQGQRVLCNTTSAAFQVTLQMVGADTGKTWGVKDVGGNAATNNVTVVRSDGGNFLSEAGVATSIVLTGTSDEYEFTYNGAEVIAYYKSSAVVDTGPGLSAGLAGLPAATLGTEVARAIYPANLPLASTRSDSDRWEDFSSLRDMGAEGDGTTDDTVAFENLFDICSDATYRRTIQASGYSNEVNGPVFFIPPGHYSYEGTGFDISAGGFSKTYAFYAHPGTVRITLPDDITFFKASSFLQLYLHGIDFYGGANIVHATLPTANVSGGAIIEYCRFLNYTGTAISHLHTDAPYWVINRCVFQGKIGAASRGIVFGGGGLADMSRITNNAFNRNAYHIVIPGVPAYIVEHNAFQRWDAAELEAGKADVWIFPRDTAVTSNRGCGMRVRWNKFGNEGLKSGDYRIIVTKADTGTGANMLTHPPSTTNSVDNADRVSSLDISENYFGGTSPWATGATAFCVASWVPLPNLIMRDNVTDGSKPGEMLRVATSQTSDRYSATTGICSVHGESQPDALPIKAQSAAAGVMLPMDPLGWMAGSQDVPSFFGGSDTGMTIVYDTMDPTFVVTSCTASNITDSTGQANVGKELDYSATSGSAHIAAASIAGMVVGQLYWLEFDIKKSTVQPLDNVKMGLEASSLVYYQRYFNLLDSVSWRTIRFPYIARGTTFNWVFRPSGWVTGSKTKFMISRLRVTKANSAGTHSLPAFMGQFQTTAPPAGAGSALPATPEGYFRARINGAWRKIPYYPD
jgi:hypothetical protein